MFQIISSGIQAWFDYISDIDKVVQYDGSWVCLVEHTVTLKRLFRIQYLVSLRRMRCPGLKEKHGKVQIGVNIRIPPISGATNNHNGNSGNALAFQVGQKRATTAKL